MTDFRHRHVLVACARWEEDDIIEWVEYHRSLNFDHIYIYSNDDDPFVLYNRLLPYLAGDDAYVTYRHWTDVGGQVGMYLHFLRHHAQEAEWAMFLDIDEFLVLKNVDDIRVFLEPYEADWDSVQFNWAAYGGAGRQFRNKRGVLLNITRRAVGIDQHIKNIFRTSAVTAEQASEGYAATRYPFLHGWDAYDLPGLRICDVLGQVQPDYSREFPRNAAQIIAQPGYAKAVLSKAYVAHFQFKAEEDFVRRAQRGGFANQKIWREAYEDGRYLRYVTNHSAVEDLYLYNYWAARPAAEILPMPYSGDGPYDLGRFKPTFQSSYYPFQPDDERASSQAGNDGVITGGFGLHTGLEDEPWWMVDLLEACMIYEIRVYNRLSAECEDRAETIRVDVSLDRENWVAVFDPEPPVRFGGIDGTELRIGVPVPEEARYVRVSLRARAYLHLDEVEVIGRRSADPPSSP